MLLHTNSVCALAGKITAAHFANQNLTAPDSSFQFLIVWQRGKQARLSPGLRGFIEIL
jgi:hypothetical protein